MTDQACATYTTYVEFFFQNIVSCSDLPTNNALLINFRLSSDAEVLLLSTD